MHCKYELVNEKVIFYTHFRFKIKKGEANYTNHDGTTDPLPLSETLTYMKTNHYVNISKKSNELIAWSVSVFA